LKGLVLDAGALIALEKRDRRVMNLLDVVLEEGGRLLIPAPVLAQVLRDPARQYEIWRLATDPKNVVLELGLEEAKMIGALLARSHVFDVVDAHVVLCGRKFRMPILTSDPKDLAALDGELELLRV
jgi:hypothetical protein